MTLLNDIQGSTRLCMTSSDDTGTQSVEALLDKLGNLPDQLPPGCCIVWVVRLAKPLKFPAHAQGRPLLPVPIYSRIDAPRGRWLQDPFLCLSGPERTELVVDKDADDFVRVAAFQIAAATGWTLRPVDLRFSGGNLLRLDDTLLVGKDLALENGIPAQDNFLKPDKAEWEALETKLATLLQVEKIVWVGLRRKFKPTIPPMGLGDPTWQPFFHLDLFLLPGGRDAQGRLLILLGKPTLNREDDDLACAQLKVLQSALDEVEANLRRDISDLAIDYLPILIALQNERWLPLSYCNGWIDCTGADKTVYLPDFSGWEPTVATGYRIETIQAAAERTMENHGFSVRFVKMKFEEYLTDGGTLHCAVKVLKRS